MRKLVFISIFLLLSASSAFASSFSDLRVPIQNAINDIVDDGDQYYVTYEYGSPNYVKVYRVHGAAHTQVYHYRVIDGNMNYDSNCSGGGRRASGTSHYTNYAYYGDGASAIVSTGTYTSTVPVLAGGFAIDTVWAAYTGQDATCTPDPMNSEILTPNGSCNQFLRGHNWIDLKFYNPTATTLEYTGSYVNPSGCDGFSPDYNGGGITAVDSGGQALDYDSTVVYKVPCDKTHCMDLPGWFEDDDPSNPDGCHTNTFTADGITYTETMCFDGAKRTTTQTGSDGSYEEECIVFYRYDPNSDYLPSGAGPDNLPGGDITQTTRGQESAGGTGDGKGAFGNQTSFPTAPKYNNQTTVIPSFNSMTTASKGNPDTFYDRQTDVKRAELIGKIKDEIQSNFPLNVIPQVSGYFVGLQNNFKEPEKPSAPFTVTIMGNNCGTYDFMSKFADLIEPLREFIRAIFYATASIAFLKAIIEAVREGM